MSKLHPGVFNKLFNELFIMEDPQPRFKVIPMGPDLSSVILTDIGFWAQHEKELQDWCDQHDLRYTGMIVARIPAKIMTLFALRWS
jgi:hypothetical protein